MTANVQYDAQNLREFMARVEDFMGGHKAPLRRVDFANLVTNGTFDSDITGWVELDAARGTVSHDTNQIRLTNDGTGNVFVYGDFPVVLGSRIHLSCTATDVGTATARLSAATALSGSDYGLELLAGGSGTMNISFTAVDSLAYVGLLASGSAGSVSDYATFDNVSAWEADPSDDAPWLRLPYGHTVGDYGLIIRDGSVLHPSDYTEITDSGQTFIKPLTAPGAATEFSVFCAPEG